MKNVFALILAGGRVDELSVLTLSRPKSAVPFGGMYRVIDFSLSNLMHSGVERVGILSQYRSFSLINHVGVGAWWDFLGRDRGATMLLPSTGHQASNWYKGTADAVYQNIEFIEEQDAEAILVLSGDHVYSMHYGNMLAVHREKDADLTIAFAPIQPSEGCRFGMAELDDDGESGGWVTDYVEKPAASEYGWASMTVYFFKPKVLFRLLEESAQIDTSHEFGKSIIPRMLGKYNVYGYKFDGYWGYTRSIDEYWQTNMDLLGEPPKIDLSGWQVRTNLDHDRLRDRSPAHIQSHGRVLRSLIHNGCQIDGEVENSILFPGVTISRGARVRNSILFFDTIIEPGARLERTIADFDVRIGAGCDVGDGDVSAANRDYPHLLNSGTTLLGKGVELPPELKLRTNCIVAPELGVDDFALHEYEAGTTIR